MLDVTLSGEPALAPPRGRSLPRRPRGPRTFRRTAHAPRGRRLEEAMTRRHVLTGAAALACLVVGVGFLLLALDVARASASFRDDDVRYRGAPDSTLWQPSEAVPGASRDVCSPWTTTSSSAVAFGASVSAIRRRRASPTRPTSRAGTRRRHGSPTSCRVTTTLHAAREPRTCSAPSASPTRSTTTRTAASCSRARPGARQAIALDPGNAEAKFNLETALASSRGLDLAESGGGTNPSPGGKGSRGAGAGDPAAGTSVHDVAHRPPRPRSGRLQGSSRDRSPRERNRSCDERRASSS